MALDEFQSMSRWAQIPLALLVLTCLWELRRSLLNHLFKFPTTKLSVGSAIWSGWWNDIVHLFNAQDLISKAYSRSNGRIFTIPGRDRNYVYVSTNKQIEELYKASTHELSMTKVVAELPKKLSPSQIFAGLTLNEAYLSVGQNIFKNHLRSHLSDLQPMLQERLKEAFELETKELTTHEGWTQISALSVIGKIVLRINTVVLVGDELGRDEKFLETVDQYLFDATVTEELLQFVPKYLRSTIGFAMMRWSGAMMRVKSALSKLALERVNMLDGDGKRPMDCVQWAVESNRKRSPEATAQLLMGWFFGSSHQMPILLVFALYRLCAHPEYVEPLRKEVEGAMNESFENHNDNLPLLDSFIKESARLDPLLIVSPTRETVNTFTFKDGTRVPAGNWIMVPQQALMQDAAVYESPVSFKGFRFVEEEKADNGETTTPRSKSRLSHPSWQFPFWGSPKQACPGRFYVSMALKLALALVLTEYDIKLADEKAPATFAWKWTRAPHPKMKFLIRKRVVASAAAA